MDHEANEDPSRISILTAMGSSIKIKKENSNSGNRKLRKRNLKMENNYNDHIYAMPSSPFDPYTTPFLNLSHGVGNDHLSYFGQMTTDQSRHLMRLIHLFPQLHIATLKGALELCNYEPIKSIDTILYALQYRKYLEAKNQGFPLNYHVRGPRVLLLPSFLGNRSTNSNVYEQILQDNTHLNGSNDVSGNIHPNCCPRQFGVTNPTVNAPVCDPRSSVSNNLGGNEKSKDTVTMSMPPKTNQQSSRTVTDNSGKENNGRGVLIDVVPGSYSVIKANSASQNSTNSGSSITIRTSGRQNPISAEKKLVKTTKIKRVFKIKHMTCCKHYNKKAGPVKTRNEPLKITTNLKDTGKISSSKPGASQTSGVMDSMDDLNDCIIIESSPQKSTAKKSQCPLGDKDCNEIFHKK